MMGTAAGRRKLLEYFCTLIKAEQGAIARLVSHISRVVLLFLLKLVVGLFKYGEGCFFSLLSLLLGLMMALSLAELLTLLSRCSVHVQFASL